MSLESLKRSRSIAWVDEKNFKENEFGPPTFDETRRAYFWRIFKRGFSWGKFYFMYLKYEMIFNANTFINI